MSGARVPMPWSFFAETRSWAISDHQLTLFSSAPPGPTRSYSSGRPRSWPYSCAKTATPPFSGWMV
jgi:hypothetical protein